MSPPAFTDKSITETDLKKAKMCQTCPVCRRARKKQAGLAFWFVRKVEGSFCPNCQAYEKVYGKKAWEAV